MAQGLNLIIIVVVAIVLIFLLVNALNSSRQGRTGGLNSVGKWLEGLWGKRQKAPYVPLPSQRPATPFAPPELLKHRYQSPFLATLFTLDQPDLPDQVSPEQFERLVQEYTEQNLTVKPLEIPRNLNFNYDHYTQVQEQMERNAIRQVQKNITAPEEVGVLTERKMRGLVSERVAETVPIATTVSSFLRKRPVK